MKRTYQTGFSIIELMIAITLGMVMMGAALQFMIGTRATYEVNDDISRVQENGRIALNFIAKDLRRAGHRKENTGDGELPFPFMFDKDVDETYIQDGGDGTYLLHHKIPNTATSNSDTIAIQFDPFESDGAETDCQGDNIDADSIVVSVYKIADIDEDGIFSLYCGTYDKTQGKWLNDEIPFQPLVDGIDNLQILYRVKNPLDDPVTYRYIGADELATSDYDNIQAARVSLLASNGSDSGGAEARSRSYRLLDSNLITTPDTDTQVRRIYTTTVVFNNLIDD